MVPAPLCARGGMVGRLCRRCRAITGIGPGSVSTLTIAYDASQLLGVLTLSKLVLLPGSGSGWAAADSRPGPTGRTVCALAPWAACPTGVNVLAFTWGPGG